MDALKILEIDQIKEQLSSFCVTEKGKQACLSLLPLSQYELANELIFLKEAVTSYPLDGRIPVSGLDDSEKEVIMASKGAVLGVEEIYRIKSLVEVAENIRSHFKKTEWGGALKERALNLPCCGELAASIDEAIGPDLSIKDGASAELKEIRRTIIRLEREIASKANEALLKNKDYLSLNTLSLRNGHYVLAVNNAYKSKVKGIIQDISSTGSTYFIEPECLVNQNNRISEEKLKEKAEINRILSSLCSLIGGRKEDLIKLNGEVGYFDFLGAKVAYGEKLDGHLGQLSQNDLYIPEARHPLLDQNKVVPNTFALSKTKPIIVISGPNAGGKTVALKTLGVVCLMFKMGMVLPCKQGAEIPYFKDVLADIGDSQSLSDNLSTFSGHMRKISEIASLSGGHSLVLLDELGTGTAPKEGEAIAIATTKYLLSKHCFAMISSHFEGLKALALNSQGIENASMLFDEAKLLPTYKLVIGLPGESYGLEVARRCGLNEEILLEAAKQKENDVNVNVAESIKKLGTLTKETNSLKEKLQKEEIQLELAKKALLKQENDFKRKKEALEKEIKEEREILLDEAREKISDALKVIGNPYAKQHELVQAKKSLDDLVKAEEETRYNEEISLGEFVEIPSYGLEGKVTKIKGDKIIIDSNGKSFQIDKSLARPGIEAPIEEKKISSIKLDNVGSSSLSLECNLIGMRAAEAKEELIHYLDQCRVKKFKRVRIIHGYGSGVLRLVVRSYLDQRKDFVDRYEGAGEHEGGGGATVVYLK